MTAVTQTATLEVQGLSAGYGGPPVLRDVNLRLSGPGLTVVLGANGAGKSTLLRALSGIVPRRDGVVRWNGVELQGLRPERIAQLGVVQVAEGRRIFRRQSVLANLRLGLYQARQLNERDAVDEMLERFPALREKLQAPAGTLSGGQQQMLALAQALISRPRLLLVDEPSIGLSPRVVDDVFATLSSVVEDGVPVLLVDQFVERALALASYAYVLRTGRIVAEGPAAEFLEGDRLTSAYFGHGRPH